MSQTKKNNSNSKVKSRKVKAFQSGGGPPPPGAAPYSQIPPPPNGSNKTAKGKTPKEKSATKSRWSWIRGKNTAPAMPVDKDGDPKHSGTREGYHARVEPGDVVVNVKSEDPGHSMQCVEDYHFLGFRDYKSIDDIIIEQVLEFLTKFDKTEINRNNLNQISDIIKNINIIILEVFKNYTLYVVKSNAYNLIIEKQEIFDKFEDIKQFFDQDVDTKNKKFLMMFHDKSKIINLIKLYKDKINDLFINTINEEWNGAKGLFISNKNNKFSSDQFNNFDAFNNLITQNNDSNNLDELVKRMNDYKSKTEFEFQTHADTSRSNDKETILKVINDLVTHIKKFYNEIQDFTHEDLKNTNCENTNDITYANKKIEELVNSYTTDLFKFDQIENLKTNIEIHQKIKEHLSEIKRSSDAMMTADNELIAVVDKINNLNSNSIKGRVLGQTQITSWSGDGEDAEQKQQLKVMRTKVIDSINSLLEKLRETKGEINDKKTNIKNEMKDSKDLNDKNKKFKKEDVEQIVTNISKFQIYNILLKSLNSVEKSLTDFVINHRDRNPEPPGESKPPVVPPVVPTGEPPQVEEPSGEQPDTPEAKTSDKPQVEEPSGEQPDTPQVEEPSGEQPDKPTNE